MITTTKTIIIISCSSSSSSRSSSTMSPLVVICYWSCKLLHYSESEQLGAVDAINTAPGEH